MELGDIIGSVISAGSGGILGVVGSVIGSFVKIKQRKQDIEFEKEKWKYEIELQKLNIEARQKETENEIALATVQGSYSGLSESIRADASITGVHWIVNSIRALYRPFLTTILWVGVAYILDGIINKNFLPGPEALEIIRYIIYTICFCASTATAWWFGDRSLSPPKMK